MAFTPQDSAIKVTKSIEEQVAAANGPEQIKEIFREAAISQGLVFEDWDPSYLVVVEKPQPRSFAKTIVIDNVKHVLESDSQQGLADAEINLYHQVFAKPATSNEPVRDAQGRFTADQTRAANTDAVEAATTISAEEKSALQIQFQLGQISAAEYIEKSGAVADFLQKQGVPIEDLKAQIVERQQVLTEQDWKSATEEFLAHSDWPGGDINRQRLGEQIISMGATEKPSVDTLGRAYEVLKAKNMLVESPESTAQKEADRQQARISVAKTPEEIREILAYREGSGIWGGR
jgi:hypothetical protein